MSESDGIDYEGWSTVRGNARVLHYSSEVIGYEDEVNRVVDWVRTLADEWAESGAGRGRRNGIFDAPVGDEKWFLKQYHHGGLLAGEDDVTYADPDRFLSELRGTLRAREAGVRTPDPRFVLIFRRGEGQYEGYFASRYLPDTRPLSQVLRDANNEEFLDRAAQSLRALHDAGIDHRDYHVKNLRVDSKNEVVVTDFDPVDFGTVSGTRRGFRVRRFNRSLLKYGFLEEDAGCFRESYWDGSTGGGWIARTVEPVLSLKDAVSDLIYWSKDRDLEPVNLEKILVRAPNWLGDTVMSLPYLQQLEAHEDVGRVDVVVRSALSAVYEAHEAVDAVRKLPNDKTMTLPGEIRSARYSSILVIPKSLRTGYQAYESGIPRRIGFATQWRSPLLTDRIPLEGRDRSEHHARLYSRLTPSLTDPSGIPLPAIEPDEKILESVRGDQDRPFFTVHPGTAYGPAKRWPPERFSAFLRELVERRAGRIVALGVEDERGIAEEVLEGVPPDRVDNRVGETSLEEAMAYLSLSEGTVANDSGIMHLSAALGTPTLGIFGSSTPDLTSPLGPRTDYVYENVECSPCFERHCPLDEDRYKCLESIEPERVLEVFLNLLDRS